METKTQKSTLMTEGSIYQKLIYFAVPLILGNFLQQMYVQKMEQIILFHELEMQSLLESLKSFQHL